MNIPCGDDFSFKSDGLYVGDVSVKGIAEKYGTPLYLYSEAQIKKNIAKIRNALNRINKLDSDDICIYYALKANRFRKVVDLIRAEGDIGIDACSPAEVVYSRECGFEPHEISYTGCFMSTKDLQILVKEGVHVNLDTISAIRKYGSMVAPNTKIGLRINTETDLGFSTSLKYGDKFGFPVSMLPQALLEAAEKNLIVDTLHFHSGWNIPAHTAADFEKNLAKVLECALLIGPALRVVDVGGGLGVLHHFSNLPSMTVDDWANLLDRCLLQPLRKINPNVRIVCEPGTGIVASSGLLVAEVNTVEQRGATTWVGVNAGSNLNCYKITYNLALTILSIKGAPEGKNEEEWPTYQVAGNINESNDMFYTNAKLPPVEDGDFLALYPCGAYGTSMMSNHCMRGQDLKEILITENYQNIPKVQNGKADAQNGP